METEENQNYGKIPQIIIGNILITTRDQGNIKERKGEKVQWYHMTGKERTRYKRRH
jgi:hypothetical protein